MYYEENAVDAEYLVLNGKGIALLEIDRASALGILKLGINALKPNDDFQEFPECLKSIEKLKDFKLKLHVNEKVRPVA